MNELIESAEKIMMRCPFCNSKKFKITEHGTFYMVSCCGFFSKLFDSLPDLCTWWNKRAGRHPKVGRPAKETGNGVIIEQAD